MPKGTSGAGGGGTAADNMALNLEIDSSRDWINKLTPQGGNTENASGGDLGREKRIETIMAQLHCSRNEAEKYAQAIEEYGAHPAQVSSESSSDLESYIKSAPRWAGGTTYHSLNTSAEAFDNDHNVGATLSLGGTSTWYSSKGKAAGQVRIESPTQSKGTGINRLSIHSGDKEVLASEASRYKIKKKFWEGRTLIVQVEEI